MVVQRIKTLERTRIAKILVLNLKCTLIGTTAPKNGCRFGADINVAGNDKDLWFCIDLGPWQWWWPRQQALATLVTLSLSISAMELPNFSDDCFFSLWPRLIRLCKNWNNSPSRFLCLTYAFCDIFCYSLIENLWNKIWPGNLWNYIFFQLIWFFPWFLLLSWLLQLSAR